MAEWLNFHHLLYFWTTAREGGVSKAALRLRLAPATVSAQLRALEEQLGEKLFERRGRGLQLTEVGRLVFRYADEIFSLGRELQETVRGQPSGQPARLVVGVADVLPKLVVRRLLEPALRLEQPVRLVVREDDPAGLVQELSQHRLDVVLSDQPLPPDAGFRAFTHELGESRVGLFAQAKLAARLRKGLPATLREAPLLLPGEGTAVRRAVDAWLDDQGVRAHVVGEFQDTALLQVFAQDGQGAFPAPLVVREQLERQGAELVCEVPGARERYYALTVERRVRHVAVAAICDSARNELFA